MILLIATQASLPDATEVQELQRMIRKSGNRFSEKFMLKQKDSKNLERVAVGFAGPDPQRVIDRGDEYLAVADLAGARAGGDDFDRLVGEG
jgi:hypothetical protein